MVAASTDDPYLLGVADLIVARSFVAVSAATGVGSTEVVSMAGDTGSSARI
jgi:hypothetical protein